MASGSQIADKMAATNAAWDRRKSPSMIFTKPPWLVMGITQLAIIARGYVLISCFADIQFRAIRKWQLHKGKERERERCVYIYIYIERERLPSRFWSDPVLVISGDGCLYSMNQIDNVFFELVGCLY